MKKATIVIIICILYGLQGVFAQTFRPWPIPSFNTPVIGKALFQENKHSYPDNTEGKRRIHIKVLSQKSPYTIAGSATVWVYSLDQTTVLGPYTVTIGETLTVDIDDREWGVLVESGQEVVVSVWITLFDSMKQKALFYNAKHPAKN
jgi:hypothetical protein